MSPQPGPDAALAKACQEANDEDAASESRSPEVTSARRYPIFPHAPEGLRFDGQEYERISRMGPYELEEVGLEAYHNNHFEEARVRSSSKVRSKVHFQF